MIDTDRYEEFENAMNEGRIERVHCLWALAEVKRLREELRITQSNFSMVRNALANQYPEIEEAIWKVIE
tara:strand:+ start:28 stop:234 length:207 start_codon:yes stop_codon:yes gene_type:complete